MRPDEMSVALRTFVPSAVAHYRHLRCRDRLKINLIYVNAARPLSFSLLLLLFLQFKESLGSIESRLEHEHFFHSKKYLTRI